MVFWDIGYLLCFELAHKMAGFLGLLPLFRAVLSQTLQITALNILSRETLLRIMQNPLAILMALLWALVFVSYFYLEFAVLALYFERGWQGDGRSFSRLLVLAVRRLGELFLPRNWLMLLGMLLVLPLLVLPYSGNLGVAAQIPDFVRELVGQRAVRYTLYGAAALLAALLLFFFLFGFRAMMVEGKRFRQACRESYRLLKGRRRQVARTLLFTCLAVVLALLAVYLVLVLVTAGITALQFHGIEARSAFQLNYLAWSQLLRVSSYVVLAGWYFGISTLLYHRLRHHHPHLGRRRRPFVRLGRSAALLCLLGVLAYFSETELGGAVFRSPEERIQVVAHRGGAALEPENTVAALQEAIVSSAEQAEIDIQQTKDGVLVVLHDPNLKRIGGVDRPIWEMTYANLRELPLREPIPTLEEAMQAVDGKLKLMIEIKVTGHEENLVRQTLGTIRRYEAEDWCCIGSMNLNTLEEVHQREPEMEVVYIAPVVSPSDYGIEWIDAFSIKHLYANRDIVQRMHKAGKDVYIWTCNTERSIRRAIRCQPEGIITDNPYLVQYFLQYGDQNRLLEFWRDVFFPLSAS